MYTYNQSKRYNLAIYILKSMFFLIISVGSNRRLNTTLMCEVLVIHGDADSDRGL